jgi:hypothetical protein
MDLPKVTGVGFIDKDEIWYLESACGHRWLACRMPKDKYFVTGNQSRYRRYDKDDKKHFLASADLIEFAEKHGLYDPKKGEFDFHEAYARDEELDTTYNYPRVWGLQKMFSPAIKNDVTKNTFPVYAEAEKKISITDMRHAFRFHYNDTEHDPYLHSNPKEPYRPCIYIPHVSDTYPHRSSLASTGYRVRGLYGYGHGRPRSVPSLLSGHHLISKGLHHGNMSFKQRLRILEVPPCTGFGHDKLQPLCSGDT